MATPADAVKITEAKEYKEQTIQVYTDERKNEHEVGSGVAIFVGKELAVKLKFKLDNRRSNNQAEQLATVKALEVIKSTNITENSPRTVTIFTDSIITLDSLKNVNNNSCLIEEIRKRISILEGSHWTIEFSWAKAHVGIYGNELADQLAKAASRNSDTTIAFSRIPKSTLYSGIEEEEAKQNRQKEWEDCTKAAITKQFFPHVQGRFKLKINITPIFATMVTGHGKTRACFHLFKTIEHATCACN